MYGFAVRQENYSQVPVLFGHVAPQLYPSIRLDLVLEHPRRPSQPSVRTLVVRVLLARLSEIYLEACWCFWLLKTQCVRTNSGSRSMPPGHSMVSNAT